MFHIFFYSFISGLENVTNEQLLFEKWVIKRKNITQWQPVTHRTLRFNPGEKYQDLSSPEVMLSLKNLLTITQWHHIIFSLCHPWELFLKPSFFMWIISFTSEIRFTNNLHALLTFPFYGGSVGAGWNYLFRPLDRFEIGWNSLFLFSFRVWYRLSICSRIAFNSE